MTISLTRPGFMDVLSVSAAFPVAPVQPEVGLPQCVPSLLVL
jgi:hypothetical protein